MQFAILNSGKCELECIKFNSLLHWELQTASHKPTAVWIPCLESLCFVCLLLFIDHNVCSTTFMQRFLMKPEYFRHRDNYGLQTTDSDFTHSQFINIPLWIAEVEHKNIHWVIFCFVLLNLEAIIQLCNLCFFCGLTDYEIWKI